MSHEFDKDPQIHQLNIIKATLKKNLLETERRTSHRLCIYTEARERINDLKVERNGKKSKRMNKFTLKDILPHMNRIREIQDRKNL